LEDKDAWEMVTFDSEEQSPISFMSTTGAESNVA
jgi:hypothetical protein